MATANDNAKEVERRYDELYEAYGRHLESAHTGEFLAISPTGQTILGTSLRGVAQKAKEAFGRGTFLYRIGDKAVGKWR